MNNTKLEAVWYGPQTEQAPTLVFLHEGLGCVELWHDFPAKVSEATGCGALVYSRQGYGRSDRCELPLPLTFMHNEGLKVLPAVIEAANIRNHILIGHSDGASISLIYAGDARVVNLLGLVVEAPHVFCEEKTVNYIRKAKTCTKKAILKNS